MKTGMRTVLLLGDSLIEYGDWQELLRGYVTFNRGVAGETTGDLAARLGWETENVSDPDHILIMSGTNNLLMGDQTFPSVFATMLPRLRVLEPEADLSLIGIAPMPLPWIKEDLLVSVNSLLKKISGQAGCRFLDLIAPFSLHCRPIGNPCFQADGVHFTPHGYRVLSRAIREHLESKP